MKIKIVYIYILLVNCSFNLYSKEKSELVIENIIIKFQSSFKFELLDSSRNQFKFIFHSNNYDIDKKEIFSITKRQNIDNNLLQFFKYAYYKKTEIQVNGGIYKDFSHNVFRNFESFTFTIQHELFNKKQIQKIYIIPLFKQNSFLVFTHLLMFAHNETEITDFKNKMNIFMSTIEIEINGKS